MAKRKLPIADENTPVLIEAPQEELHTTLLDVPHEPHHADGWEMVAGWREIKGHRVVIAHLWQGGNALPYNDFMLVNRQARGWDVPSEWRGYAG